MRRTILLPLFAGALTIGVAACGSDDPDAFTTLPPIATTTTTTTTTTTVSTERVFYTIKSGDSLRIIAETFGVTIQAIVELNNIQNPDNIQAGQTIEIPSGIVVITDLPTTTAG